MDKQEDLNMMLPELPEVANNRAERRAQLRHFTKMLKEHEARMPVFDVNEEDTAKRQEMQMKVMAWGGMKMRIQNRIAELQPKKPGNAS